jgi:uncharacterized LabA/DUF88 family protein
MQRVMAYVDGFNLYFGLKSKGWRRYYWLDLHRLIENLLRPDQQLVGVRYFTARISARRGHSDKQKRQATFLEALETLPALHIHYGHYLVKQKQCRNCGATWETHEEKMTDVNIAVELLGDAQDDRFDTAIIVSGDSDLTTPVRAVRQRYPEKRVVVAFPPGRDSVRLRQAATAAFRIGRKKFKDSQLPDRVVKADGFVLERPTEWK